jgi:hypothetical protein
LAVHNLSANWGICANYEIIKVANKVLLTRLNLLVISGYVRYCVDSFIVDFAQVLAIVFPGKKSLYLLIRGSLVRAQEEER